MSRIFISLTVLGLLALGVYGGIGGHVLPATLALNQWGATAVPGELNVQGIVLASGVRFNGSGQFKFAIIDPATSNSVWSHDGSGVGSTNPPTSALSLSVVDGLYSVRLGDSSLGMPSLTPAVFGGERKLRVWFSDGVHGLNQLSPDQPLSSSPYAFVAGSVVDGAITQDKLSSDLDGWIKAGESWSFAAANAPSFTVTVAGDKTAQYSPGMRCRLTQGTSKYFLVTAASYASPNTTLTLYGGSDYTLADAAIDDPCFSHQKAPAGFPIHPDKWVRRFTQTGGSTIKVNSASAETWYAITGTVTLPPGQWLVSYGFTGGFRSAAAGLHAIRFTLSTNTTAITHPATTSGFIQQVDSGSVHCWQNICKNCTLDLSTQSTFYLLTKCGLATSYLGYWCNGEIPIVIEAMPAGL